MKTYILSVNTLMWNLTSERHDNCAPCLGLILPIRWVTPQPNSSLECFLLALHLLSLRIWFIFNIDLSSWWSSLWWFSLTQIYTYICVLSSTAFTYSYVFLFESFDLSECDRTLTSLWFLSQILSIQIICILLKLSIVFSESLSAEDTETKIESILMLYILIAWNPKKSERPADGPGVCGNMEQLPMCCMHATCPSDVNRQGHQRNYALQSLSL